MIAARLFAAGAVAVSLSFGACVLAGCQSQDGNTGQAAQTMTIGEKQGDAWELSVSNSSEKSIVGLAIKYPGEETHTTNLMTSDQRIANGESATLLVEQRGDTSGEAYYVDIKVTFVDGLVSDLHHIDMKDLSQVTVYLKGKIAYVMYESKAAHGMVSTLELQTWWYNYEDPDAAARDAAEEEEEKRRLEKLEEDLRSYEESVSNTSASNTSASNTTNETEEDVQGADVEDDPQEFESDDRDYDTDE